MIWKLVGGTSRRIDREAARWRAEMEEPSSGVQVEAFEAWLKADPSHLAAYQESDAVAEAGARLRTSSRDLSRSPLVAPRYRPAFAVAATVALALGLWGLIRDPAPAYASVTNRGQATRVVALREGSVITLDTGTTLDVAIDPAAHHIRMSSGRARFLVHLPSGERLRLTAPTGEVSVANGTFDLAVANDGVRVWVISGAAEVSVPAASGSNVPVSLIAGRGAKMSAGATNATPIDRPDTSWPIAHVAFEQTPLASILDIANREGAPKISVADGSLGALKVTGVMDLRDSRKLAHKLAAALDLHPRSSGTVKHGSSPKGARTMSVVR